MNDSADIHAPPPIWLLLDERASHRSQILGVAERLDLPFAVKELRYNRLAGLPNAVLGGHLWHLTAASAAAFTPPWPAWAIAAGRRAAPVSLYIKRQSRGVTRLAHLMWPDAAPKAFDLIALPRHDAPQRAGGPLLFTLGAPHRVTPALLRAQAARWQERTLRLPRPHIALLIGGDARQGTYEEADFKTLAAYASAEAERLGGSLLVTSSPRTGEKGEALVQPLLTAPHLFHRWRADGDNPFLAFLGLADAVIVTSDSVSMCSEACATGKPVYIFAPPHLGGGKKSFRDTLFAEGYAKPHTFPIRLDWRPAPFPDAASVIAGAIRAKLSESS